MSSRVTRSSARLAAAASNSTGAASNTAAAEDQSPPARNRKRKASTSAVPGSEQTSNATPASSSTRTKRQKVTVAEAATTSPPASRRRASRSSAVMAKQGYGPRSMFYARKLNVCSRSSSETPGEKSNSSQPAPEASKRKSSRNKKSTTGTSLANEAVSFSADIFADSGPSTSTPGAMKRSKKSPPVKVNDTTAADRGEALPDRAHAPNNDPAGDDDSDLDEQGNRRAYEDDEDDHDDPFRAGFLGAGGPPGHISSTLRALTGMVSGVSHRFRDLLEKLRQNDDHDAQMYALTELSEILLISTEDNLSGHFSPDQFIKELVSLLKGDTGTGAPEMMLLACRGIANMMEALPPSTANVVYGGAVTELVKKLRTPEYIDLAEQALSVGTLTSHMFLEAANPHRL